MVEKKRQNKDCRKLVTVVSINFALGVNESLEIDGVKVVPVEAIIFDELFDEKSL